MRPSLALNPVVLVILLVLEAFVLVRTSRSFTFGSARNRA